MGGSWNDGDSPQAADSIRRARAHELTAGKASSFDLRHRLNEDAPSLRKRDTRTIRKKRKKSTINAALCDGKA